MTGIPMPEQLAALVAVSRQQGASGPPQAMSRPVVMNEEGYAFGLCPDDPDGAIGAYVRDSIFSDCRSNDGHSASANAAFAVAAANYVRGMVAAPATPQSPAYKGVG